MLRGAIAPACGWYLEVTREQLFADISQWPDLFAVCAVYTVCPTGLGFAVISSCLLPGERSLLQKMSLYSASWPTETYKNAYTVGAEE